MCFLSLRGSGGVLRLRNCRENFSEIRTWVKSIIMFFFLRYSAEWRMCSAEFTFEGYGLFVFLIPALFLTMFGREYGGRERATG